MTEAFEKLVALLDYPMFVVTTRTGSEQAGCLVGFASQVSIHPPRFLAGLSKLNHTYRVANGASHLAVHLIERRHGELARLYGSVTGDRPTNSPAAHGVRARTDCRFSTTRPGGSPVWY